MIKERFVNNSYTTRTNIKHQKNVLEGAVPSEYTHELAKLQNISLNTTHSARNLGFIFDENLTFSDQISSLSRSCYYHIRQLRCMRPYIDFKTANTIATSIVHSKLDYCNSLYFNLPKTQINRLQHIQNSLARTVANTPKYSHYHQFLNLFTG